MPSHIFTRVGAWADSAATNRRSADGRAEEQRARRALHALDYMTYAYLQLARDGDARRTFDEARTLTGINPARATGPYALAAMPARYAVERGDWRDAAKLEPSAEQVSVHRGDDAFRARSRRGAERRSRRGAERTSSASRRCATS